MERAVSKAMALIEATSDYFEDVARLIELLVTPTRKLSEELAYLYRDRVGLSAEPTEAENLRHSNSFCSWTSGKAREALSRWETNSGALSDLENSNAIFSGGLKAS